MAYLHENKEEFANAVNLASLKYHILPEVAEKDYYVTMILRELSARLPFIVFKGGTSLSKCHKAIKRFSEDIDLTIDTRITEGQMKKLKKTIQSISETLGLSIPNIHETRSRRSYNRYIIQYDSVMGGPEESVSPSVLVETSFAEVSFPTEILSVHSYIGDLMKTEAPGALEDYFLDTFDMKVQSLDRTLADKVFAICDYYLEDRTAKHSRHIYDIFKLLPLVPQTEQFRLLVKEVREERAKNNICPSAKPGVNVPALLSDIVVNQVYKSDYEMITSRLLEEDVSYPEAIDAIRQIAATDMFSE